MIILKLVLNLKLMLNLNGASRRVCPMIRDLLPIIQLRRHYYPSHIGKPTSHDQQCISTPHDRQCIFLSASGSLHQSHDQGGRSDHRARRHPRVRRFKR